MLNYLETHLLIEQGLNTLGLFSEKANLHEQIDLAFSHVVVTDLNRIIRLKPKERDAIEEQVATMLSSNSVFKLEKEGQFYTTVWTPSFLLGKPTVVLGSVTCTEENPEEVKGTYKAKTFVTYDGKNYNEGSFFELTDKSKLTYGEASKVTVKYSQAIPVDIGNLESLSESVTWGKGMPLVSFDKDKIKVSYKRKDAIPLKIQYRSLREIADTEKLSWCKKQDFAMPSNIQDYYVDKVIAYLAVINEKEQQNIINLKTETLT